MSSGMVKFGFVVLIGTIIGWNYSYILAIVITLILSLFFFLSSATDFDVWFGSFAKKYPNYNIVDVLSTKIHFDLIVKEGADKTIVIAPDPPNTIEHYHSSSILSSLSEENNANVICFDMPGFGFSTAKKGFSFEPKEVLEIIEKFIEISKENYELKGKFILSFPCVSGYCAFLLAEKRPDLISHLIVCQTPLFSEEKKWAERCDIKGLISTKYIGQLLLIASAKSIAKAWIHLACFSKENARNFSAIVSETQSRGSQFPLSSALQSTFFYSSPLSIPQKGIILWGKEDKTHRRTNKKSVTEYFKEGNYEYHELDEISHFPDLENPPLFLSLVNSFLSCN